MSLGHLVIWLVITGTAASDKHIADNLCKSSSCGADNDEFALLQVSRMVVDSHKGRYNEGGDGQEAEGEHQSLLESTVETEKREKIMGTEDTAKGDEETEDAKNKAQKAQDAKDKAQKAHKAWLHKAYLDVTQHQKANHEAQQRAKMLAQRRSMVAQQRAKMLEKVKLLAEAKLAAQKKVADDNGVVAEDEAQEVVADDRDKVADDSASEPTSKKGHPTHVCEYLQNEKTDKRGRVWGHQAEAIKDSPFEVTCKCKKDKHGDHRSIIGEHCPLTSIWYPSEGTIKIKALQVPVMCENGRQCVEKGTVHRMWETKFFPVDESIKNHHCRCR